MKGIISNDYGTLLLAAHHSERKRPGVKTCTKVGGGEIPAEYLTVYETVEIRRHPDEARKDFALVAVVDDKKVRVDAVRAEMAAKRIKGTATAAETRIADLPAEVELDASWDSAPAK